MAAIDFPNPSDLNPDTGNQYANGWFNAGNGVTYVYANNTWSAATVNNANFDDLYVNEEGGDHMEGPLTIGPDDDVNNATIELDAGGTISIGSNSNPVTGNAIIAYNQSGGTYYARNNGNDPVFQGAGNPGTVTSEIGADGSAEFAGDVQMASQNGGPLAGFRNYLINGDYLIAQRYSNYPWTATGVIANPIGETKWGPDRWGSPQFREFQSRSERPSNAFSGSFQWRTGTQTSAVWHQVIELLSDGSAAPRNDFLLECDNWTVSHWIFAADRSNFVCDIEYVNASYSPSISESIALINDEDWKTVETQGDWIRVAASFSMSGVAAAPAGALGVRVQFRNNTNIRAVGAQLEPGPVATPFEHRPIGTELALCQRYYQKLGQIDAYARINNGTDLGRRWYSARTVTMRDTPHTETAVAPNPALWGTGPTAMGDAERWVLTGTARNSNDSTSVTSMTADAEL